MRFLLTCLALTVSAPAEELLVAAASDLAPLEISLKQQFRAKTGATLRFSFGSSGMLARQLRNGAPFDVFLSANEEFVRELAQAGAVEPESVRVFALGRLALYSRDPALGTLSQLAAPGLRHIAIANPRHAPYGVAAEQALKNAGVHAAVAPRLVLAENVRQAYEFARTGNAEAALVAWSLVRDQGGVLLPASLHEPIRQTAAIRKGTPRAALARRLLDWLGSAEGRALLTRYGFSPE
jgi:molybdate transport system substrate-binding protein